jgi:hypothetical protein
MVSKINADGTAVITRSVSETGHAKNADSFKELLRGLTDFGSTYQPASEHLQLWPLSQKEQQVDAAMTAWTIAIRDDANSENERTTAYASLASYCTRILNTLISSGNVSDLTIKDAQSIINKIRGARSAQGTKAIEGAIAKGLEQPRTISVSQQSYDHKLAHFAALHILVASQPTYNPNEPDLKLTAIEAYENKLRTSNINVISARSKLIDARNHRDVQLYHPDNGVVNLSKEIKSYVKAIYGSTNPNYKKISGIPFKALTQKASTL